MTKGIRLFCGIQKFLQKVFIPSLIKAPIEKGTRVLVRADFDVPMRNGKVEDDFRLRAVIPSLRFIIKKGGSVRIISHRKRPHGKAVMSFSMKHIASQLERLLEREVVFIRDPLHTENVKRFNADPRILFFENIRFWPGEEKNDSTFAKKLAQWGDLYVNEAFAVSHRRHASVVALAGMLPAYAGIGFEKEVCMFQKILLQSKKPIVVVLGGAKARTKLPFLITSIKNGYSVLTGGVLASTVLWKESVMVGKSMIDRESKDMLKEISLHTPNLHLPKDVVVARGITKKPRIAAVGAMGREEAIYDIGPETVRYFSAILQQAKTIIWNGPLGVAEVEKFAQGTVAIARVIREKKAFKITGGGDSVAVFKKNNLLDAFTHVSTGGGAMLAFLAGEELPGIEALKKQDSIFNS